MTNKQHLKSQYFNNYLGIFRISKEKEIKCYTKKQMYSLYPKKACKFVGEYKSENLKDKKDCIGDLSVDNISLNLNKYKFNNRLFYAEKGYLKCDENSFVVLLKNVIFKRILVTFFIISIFLGLGYFILESTNNVSESVRNFLDIDPNISNWDDDTPYSESNPGETKIPGFAIMKIPKNSTNINISLGNPADNNCYFVISIIIDNNTELFKSGLIPPGKGLYNITLSKPLPPGEYDAILRYETFDLDTQNELNGADLNIKIISQ